MNELLLRLVSFYAADIVSLCTTGKNLYLVNISTNELLGFRLVSEGEKLDIL